MSRGPWPTICHERTWLQGFIFLYIFYENITHSGLDLLFWTVWRSHHSELNFCYWRHILKCDRFLTIPTGKNLIQYKNFIKLNLGCFWSFRYFYPIPFVIFNPWKLPWNWIAFSQISFVISPGLLYHLIRRDTGRHANEAFTSNPIVTLKQ